MSPCHLDFRLCTVLLQVLKASFGLRELVKVGAQVRLWRSDKLDG